MSQRFVDFLSRRPARERGLIGVLILGVIPLAVVFGLLLPLNDRASTAAQAQDEARALQDWLVRRVHEKQSLASPSSKPNAPTAPLGSAGLEASLIAAELRYALSTLATGEAGVIEMQFDAVPFVALANWISAQQHNWGYEMDSFRFEALADTGVANTDPANTGKVGARIVLRPAVQD